MTAEPASPIIVCLPPAELDASSRGPFDTYLRELPATTALVVDMGELTFIDSTGFRTLKVAQQRLESGGGSLVLRDPSAHVSRMLAITGLDTILRTELRDS